MDTPCSDSNNCRAAMQEAEGMNADAHVKKLAIMGCAVQTCGCLAILHRRRSDPAVLKNTSLCTPHHISFLNLLLDIIHT